MISASPVTAQHTNMRDTAMHVQQHSPKTTWPGCGKTPLPRFFVVTITPPSPDTSLAAMPVSKVDRRAQLRLAESGEGVPRPKQDFARKWERAKSGGENQEFAPAAGVCPARAGGHLAIGGGALWLADPLSGAPGWARAESGGETRHGHAPGARQRGQRGVGS